MGALQIASWAAAFTLAVALFARESRIGLARFVLALWAGALFAHLGWGLLHGSALLRHPEALLRPGAASVLFVPLGVLVVAPWREALTALPLALLVARLGCLPYGCCYAVTWHAVVELAGLAALHVAARTRPAHAATLVLSGLGLLRLVVEPLRAEIPGLLIPPAWVALVWVATGLALGGRIGSVRDADPPDPGGARIARPLALMLAVWALFPLAGATFAAPDTAALAACAGATTLVVLARGRVAVRSSSCARSATGLALGALSGYTAFSAARALVPWAPGPGAAVDESAFVLLAVVGLSPVFEEILYRDRLLRALRPLCGTPGAVLASAVLGAVAHVQPAAMPVPLALGVVTGTLVVWTGSLPLAVGLHAGWNLAATAPG